MSSLHDFAREAEQQYRRLAELADTAGVASAGSALRQKAARMKALLEGSLPETAGTASEVFVVLTELQAHLDRVLQKWPPESLAEAVNEVLAAADRLTHLGEAQEERPRPPARPRRRWTAKDPPATKEPPSFPGPKGPRK